MAMSDILERISQYTFKGEELDRVSLGLGNSASILTVVKWRLSDLVLLGTFVVLYFFSFSIKPFQRQFYVNDLTISHPFAEVERVSGNQLFLYSVWVPLAVIMLIGLAVTKPRNKIYLTYVSLLGLFLSVLSTSLLTDILKNFIGRHRPDFLARCQPAENTPINVLVYAKDVCTTDDMSTLLDGFRTTPSGHSSISFAGLFYLSLWIAGQFIAANHRVGNIRVIVSAIPSVCAAIIALSRTEDYRHHFVDILIGSSIGSIIAYWSYFRLFPSLKNPRCYETLLILEEEDRDISPTSPYHRLGTEV